MVSLPLTKEEGWEKLGHTAGERPCPQAPAPSISLVGAVTSCTDWRSTYMPTNVSEVYKHLLRT